MTFAVHGAAGSRPDKAEVLLQTTIDAVDITVLRGGGAAVGKWALDHGYLLTPDVPKVLEFYSQRSPIFMAVRFDANRAPALGQTSGDGTPIMLTIPTDEPWVPLRILALGQDRAKVIDADVFLLTDNRPCCVQAAPASSWPAVTQRPRACSPTCVPTREWAGCLTRCGSATCA